MQPLIVEQDIFSNPSVSDGQSNYRACIAMVYRILSRQTECDLDEKHFKLFADVAYFIDNQFDKLSLEEKRFLKKEFNALFDFIVAPTHFVLFHHNICKFITDNRIEIPNNDRGLHDVFSLVELCKKLKITNELKAFAETIINAGIQKHTAKNSIDIKIILKKEGKAATNFLKKFIQRKYEVNSLELDTTFKYLAKLEHSLNLADDLLDIRQDRRANLLSSNLRKTHIFYLSYYVITSLCGLLFRYHIQFFTHCFEFITLYVSNGKSHGTSLAKH
jgi:hypothetical protein